LVDVGKVTADVAKSIETFFRDAFKARIAFWRNSELDTLNIPILTLLGYILIAIAKDHLNQSAQIQDVLHSIIVSVIFVMFVCGLALMVDSKITSTTKLPYLRNVTDLIFIWLTIACFVIWLDQFPGAGWIGAIDKTRFVGPQWELMTAIAACLIAAPFILLNSRALEGSWEFARERRVVCWAVFEFVVASLAVWEIVFEVV
jgi:hypothetical protein